MLGTLTLFSVASIEVKRVWYGPDGNRRNTLDLVLTMEDGSKMEISNFGVLGEVAPGQWGRRAPEIILNLGVEDRFAATPEAAVEEVAK